MEGIVFVPGAGGSILELDGQQIWPPSLQEFIFGYQHVAELQEKAVKATGIFDVYPPGAAVYCYDVYRTLQGDLNDIADQSGATRLDFFYDWRRDVTETADKLAKKIAGLVSDGCSSVTLVCHSMGNLVARYILESGKYSAKAWFDKIDRYVGICGPHFGVPEALEYALGDKGWLSISPSDVRTLSANPGYAASYQCLPFRGRGVLFDASSGLEDFYDSAVAGALGLNAANLQAALKLQQAIGVANAPPATEYRLIAASDQLTDETIEYDGTSYDGTKSDYAGDGTIPLWSASVPQVQTSVTPGDHVGVLSTYPFKQILYGILTAGTLAPRLTLAEKPGVALCLNKFSFAPHEPIEVLIVPDLRSQELSGSLQIAHVKAARQLSSVRYVDHAVAYLGPQIQSLRMTIPAPSDPGGYRMTFEGSHGTSSATAAGFVVTSPSARTGRKRGRT
jgi:hypothetical protein